MSFLHQQIRHYLAYRHWQQSDFTEGINTLSQLRQLKQEKAFQRTAKQQLNKWQKAKGRSHQHFFQGYRLYLEKYRMSIKKSRVAAEGLQAIANNLDTFYISESLRVACLMLAHQTINPNTQYDFTLLKETLIAAQSPKYRSVPEIAIYYHNYHALKTPGEPKHFQTLMQLITSHSRDFAKEEMRDIYLMAINYCIKKLNQGERDFVNAALDLYKIGLEQRILFEEGNLSRFTYNNVLTLSLIKEDFAWARTFLESYKKHLPVKRRETIYLYNLTIYHFKKKDYLRVMELLQQVQFRDVLYNLDTRRMLLRSYFELGEFNALDSLLDSFQVFIRRRNDLGYHREHFMNLIKFMRKFLSAGHLPTERKQLLKKVENTPSVADKEWLIEKITAY
jgi:hypothetical protein